MYINDDHRRKFSLHFRFSSYHSISIEVIRMNRTVHVTPVAINSNECYPNEEEINQSYDLVLHIVSVFILFIVSLISASIAVITTRVKALRINPIVINTGKFFGSG